MENAFEKKGLAWLSALSVAMIRREPCGDRGRCRGHGELPDGIIESFPGEIVSLVFSKFSCLKINSVPQPRS
jgi:hypothetical protein